MLTLKRGIGRILVLLVLASAATAQDSRAPIETLREPVGTASTAPIVRATATADRVRFVAPGSVVQLRLEVYSETGQKVFDTELRGGNVLDWHLQDGAGQRLVAGTYASVLTIKSLSGRLSQRVGAVTVDETKATFESTGTARFSPAQQSSMGPVEANAAFAVRQDSEVEAMTAVTHDGTDSQLTSTSGALTLRTGDLFTARDVERVRITPEGNVGIGTTKPEAKLDVAGTIRAERVVIARGVSGKTDPEDATRATDAGGSEQPLASGSGTQNRIAKWIDNAGALGDSVITETAGGFVGLGTTNPGGQLHIFGTATQDIFSGMGPDVVAGPAFNYGYAGSSFGRGAGFFNVRPDAAAVAPNPSLRFMTTNVERMIITNVGNVGIGTTAPAARLQVAGNVNFTGFRTEVTSVINPNVIGGGASNVVTAGVTGATIGGGNFNSVLDNRGTIGGGSENLVGGDSGGTCCDDGATVGGGNRNQAQGRFSTVAGGVQNIATRESATVAGGAGNNAINSFSTIGGGLNNSTPGPMATISGGELNSATAQYSTIGGGRGNTASGLQATVPGGTENTAEGSFSFAAGQRARALHAGSFVWSDSTTVSPNFFSSTLANQFLINATGGVGIGTTVPDARFHVLGDSSAANLPVAVLESSGTQVPLSLKLGPMEFARIRVNNLGNLVFATLNGTDKDIFFRAGDDSSTDMFIDSATGNVGIGTTSPDARLDVSGAVKIGAPAAGSGVALCRNGTSGLIVDCSGSSVRYKQNIFGLRSGLAVVGRLRPVSFTWKEDGQRDIGLVAEEVNRVEPLLVTRNAAGEVSGVRYDRLAVVLLNAVKEQQAQLQEKHRHIEKMESRLAVLETLVKGLGPRLPAGKQRNRLRGPASQKK